MTRPTPPDDDSTPPDALELVIEHLERFERAWAEGDPPRVEDLLTEVDPPLRPRLLRELLLTELEHRRRRGEHPTAEVYRARFPELAEVVAAVFAASPGPVLDPSRDAARNLLFGLLAFQNGFIDRDVLLGAFNAWVADRARPIGRLLVERGALDEPLHALLEALAARHLAQHGDDPERSLADLSTVGSVLDDLGGLPADDVQASLAAVGRDRDEQPTATCASGPFARRPGGRFRILRLHAQGGLGRVYEAEDTELGRKVAVKEIQPDKSDCPDLRLRFLLEAEITGGLQHPGIVPVYSLGHYDDGKPFYAMRFVEGASLRDRISAYHVEHPRPDPTTKEFRDLLDRFLDVCHAIAFAHSRGVLHRDLKPHNVMIGDYGEALIIDWGLAKATGRPDAASARGLESATLTPPSGSRVEATHAGRALGSPSYMSPEQARRDHAQLGPATDVYGLGAILYQMLTGQPPVLGQDRSDVLRRVIAGEVAPPRTLNSRVPVTLEAIALKALAKDPSERYATARALADDLGLWMADEPTTARRDPPLVRIGRWTRKHKIVTASAAAALVVGLASVSIGLQRERLHAANLDRQRQSAERQRQRAESREQDAIAAARRFGEVVSKNRDLKDRPELAPLRKQLLSEPLSFFKSLRDRLQSDRETRPEALARLGAACTDLGILTSAIDDKQGALTAYHDALAIHQKLADADPADTRFQSALALSHVNIGIVLRETGQPAEALRAHEQARAIWRKLADANPTVNQFQEGLSGSHTSIGLVLRATGRPAEALRAFEQARAIHRKLANANPTVAEFQSDLANSHNNIGVLLRETGHPSEALRAHEQARAIQRKLSDANSTLTEFQSRLAMSHNNIGSLLSETGRPDEALRAFEQARAIFQRLADANPTVTLFQSELAASHHNIGVLLSATGRPAEALRAHEQARAIRQKLADANPTVTLFQSDLADSHNNLGNLLSETGQPAETLRAHEQARAIRQKLADANPTVTLFQSRLAMSHNNIGLLLSDAGRPDEALRALEQARAIRQKLADANPTVTEFQSDLADSHNGIGVLLSATGRPSEALRAYEQARAIRQKLADANPTVTQFQSRLADSHNNIGLLLNETGRPAEALRALEQARAIRQKLADANPTVTLFQSGLAASHNGIGVLLSATGHPAEALRALEQARAIQQKLVDANSAVTQFQSDLAGSHHGIGNLLLATGHPSEALRALEQARAIRQKLAADHPESPDLASNLGATLSNLAFIDLDARRFAQARDRLREAITWQKKALAANPRHPTYRQFLGNHYRAMAMAAQGLNDAALAAEARRGLAELDAGDPRLAALDARLKAVIGGAAPKDDPERLALARRAYDTQRHAAAARLWAEALAADPKLAADRQVQHPYNAACSAALAAAGVSNDDPPPDGAAREALRKQALGWLQSELSSWKPLLAQSGPRAAVLQVLRHWKQDADLASVREPAALAQLPGAEQTAWNALWSEVDRLAADPASPALPDLPADVFAPP